MNNGSGARVDCGAAHSSRILTTVLNVGGGELLLITFVALMLLGPEKLPGAVRQVGAAITELRRAAADHRSEVGGASERRDRDAECPGGVDEGMRTEVPATRRASGPPQDRGAEMVAAQSESENVEALQRAAERDRRLGREPFT